MRGSRLFLVGLTAYGLFLVATLPASVVASRAAQATGGQVRVANATGTVWHGSARVDIATRVATITLDEVRWNFLPSRLLGGRAAYAVDARMGGFTAQAEAARSPLQWQVRDLRANGDASALAAFFPLGAAWQPVGAIAIEAPHLAWDGERTSGEATAEWRDAALALSQVRPLGSWRARAQDEGSAMKITLATTKGPLRLSGSGTLAKGGRLAFSGEARAEPGRERELEAVLDLLGPRRADGARALEVR